jgi:uridine kinase
LTITNLAAIAGGTCAGKTRLSESLIAAIPYDAVVLSQDNFYPDRSSWNYSELTKFNWDGLKSFDLDRINSCLCELISGQPISAPQYNRVTHAIDHGEARTIAPARVLILEGLHAIELARHCLQQVKNEAISLTAIFIECESLERRHRRMQREFSTKTISGDFAAFWEERCEPTFQAQVLPQRRLADLIVRSPWTSEALADVVARVT